MTKLCFASDGSESWQTLVLTWHNWVHPSLPNVGTALHRSQLGANQRSPCLHHWPRSPIRCLNLRVLPLVSVAQRYGTVPVPQYPLSLDLLELPASTDVLLCIRYRSGNTFYTLRTSVVRQSIPAAFQELNGWISMNYHSPRSPELQ